MRVRIVHPGILKQRGIERNAVLDVARGTTPRELLFSYDVEKTDLIALSVILNGQFAGMDDPLSEEDEVGFFFAALGG